MPEISRFLGINIRLYYRDPGPLHIHAEYSDYEVTVDLQSGEMTGTFPRRAKAALVEWYGMHKQDLLSFGELASQERQLDWIEPLE